MSIFSAQQIAEIIVSDNRETGKVFHSTDEICVTKGWLNERYPVRVHNEHRETTLVLRSIEEGINELSSLGFSDRQITLFYRLYDLLLENQQSSIAAINANSPGNELARIVSTLTSRLAAEIIDIQQSEDRMFRHILQPEFSIPSPRTTLNSNFDLEME